MSGSFLKENGCHVHVWHARFNGRTTLPKSLCVKSRPGWRRGRGASTDRGDSNKANRLCSVQVQGVVKFRCPGESLQRFDIVTVQQCLGKSRTEVPRTQIRLPAACPAMSASCGTVINCTRIRIAVSWLTYHLLDGLAWESLQHSLNW